MTNRQRPSKILHVLLWIVQVLLSATFIWAAAMKLFKPAGELAAMWPWTAAYPILVKVTGIIDLLAAAGLVLPGLLRIKPELVRYTAYGTVALMAAACIFHLSRGEAAVIGINVVFAAFAAFIAWGRR
jgi:hypothetical protein